MAAKIDASALKKFQQTFGPAIEAIPAVLEATAMLSDLDRQVARQRKDIEKTEKEISEAVDAANQTIEQKRKECAEVEAKKQGIVDEIRVLKVEAEADAKAAKSTADAAVKKVKDRLSKVQSELDGFEKELAKKRKAAQAEHDEKKAAFEAEIKDLEKTKASVERSLENLRKKIG